MITRLQGSAYSSAGRILSYRPLRLPVSCLQRRGGRACCGVTTGQLFCAMVGSQRRSEYTVFGNAINLR